MQYSELIIYIGTLEPRNFPYLLYFSLNSHTVDLSYLACLYNIWWEMIIQQVSVNLMLFPNLPNSYTYIQEWFLAMYLI